MILSVLILLTFAPLAIFWSLWLVFALLSLLPARRLELQPDAIGKIRIDILIPAHNEELLLPNLLHSLQKQTPAGQERLGRVLVIADHCCDSTAAIARAMGAMVLERSPGPRGKPAALRDGLEHLRGVRARTDDEAALAILDADCTVSANFVEETARALDAGRKVMQCRYILQAAAGSSDMSPSLLAFALKNAVRPRGMARLGIPTQLFGTGMCFHPELVPGLSFRDHLIEDLALSHELLLTDHPPTFIPAATVSSPIPVDTSAMSVQKLRWEAGQVHTWKKIPLLLLRLLFRGRIHGIVALLDWSAPPLAMALFAWVILSALAMVLYLLHLIPAWTLLAPAFCITGLILYVIVGVLHLAGPLTLLRLFAAVPQFLYWKATLYTRIFTGRSPTTWQRTPRKPTTEVHP